MTSNEPILNAYPDEQDKLDKDLENETRTWAEIKEVTDRNGYDLRIRLTDGVPDMYLEKM
jgi:hypothetical protein